MTKVLVLYYSSYGHIEQMADAERIYHPSLGDAPFTLRREQAPAAKVQTQLQPLPAGFTDEDSTAIYLRCYAPKRAF